jgi:hypothetical protein
MKKDTYGGIQPFIKQLNSEETMVPSQGQSTFISSVRYVTVIFHQFDHVSCYRFRSRPHLRSVKLSNIYTGMYPEVSALSPFILVPLQLTPRLLEWTGVHCLIFCLLFLLAWSPFRL